MGASALTAVIGRPATAAEVAQQEARIAQAKTAAATFLTRLLLLGTAGGPTYWPNTNRRNTSSALVVGDAVYLIDCGDGVGKRLQEALEPLDQRSTMKTLRAVFLTHLHSDHVIDYPNILLYGWFAGIESAVSPLRVFGPGRRGRYGAYIHTAGAAGGRAPGDESEQSDTRNDGYDKLSLSGLRDRHKRSNA